MTNNVAVMLGTVLTAALLPGADDLAQLTLTVTGGGLLTWFAVMQGRELARTQKELREVSREARMHCKNCELARAANGMLHKAGNEYMKEEQ